MVISLSSHRHSIRHLRTLAMSMRCTTIAATTVPTAVRATTETAANAASRQIDEAGETAPNGRNRDPAAHQTPTTVTFTNSGEPKRETVARHVLLALVRTTRTRTALAKTIRTRETFAGGADSRISSSPRRQTWRPPARLRPAFEAEMARGRRSICFPHSTHTRSKSCRP